MAFEQSLNGMQEQMGSHGSGQKVPRQSARMPTLGKRQVGE